jgi:uncharacterized repeat protein (TIGR03803 family)
MAEPETIFYSFMGGADGQYPGPPLLTDRSGDLFGTASFGGTHGVGTAFKLTAQGQFSVLHSFGGAHDGYLPMCALIADAAGNLYGTAYEGGRNMAGIVFRLTPAGSETVLHDFTVRDGANPSAGLVFDHAGTLYGTTYDGGQAGDGVVFSLSPAGKETVLHNFTGGQDGANPVASLVFGKDGKLYGTTEAGGGSAACQGGCGTIFRTDPTTGHTDILHGFQGVAGGDGAAPVAPILFAKSGTLYGTSYGGGSGSCLPGGCGTVFSLSKAGIAHIVLAFDGAGGGANPEAGLTLGAGGALIGTTPFGGATGNGLVFRLDAGTGHEAVLHGFGGGRDGSAPVGGVIFGPGGGLFGVTKHGGAADSGVIFRLTKTMDRQRPP